MSNGNSKLPPNSGMSDERWLSKDQRGRMEHVIHRHPKRDEVFDKASELETIHEDTRRTAQLLDHAEAADELVTELAVCIDYWWSKHDCMGPDDCYCGGYDGPIMTARRRVDALTKDTA